MAMRRVYIPFIILGLGLDCNTSLRDGLQRKQWQKKGHTLLAIFWTFYINDQTGNYAVFLVIMMTPIPSFRPSLCPYDIKPLPLT